MRDFKIIVALFALMITLRASGAVYIPLALIITFTLALSLTFIFIEVFWWAVGKLLDYLFKKYSNEKEGVERPRK